MRRNNLFFAILFSVVLPAIPAIALAISAIALAISIKACSRTDKLNYLHIEPTVDCFFYQDDNSSSISVKNNSPIKVVSLSVNHKSYVYQKSTKKYITEISETSILDSRGANWIFKKSMEPNDVISKSIVTLYTGFKYHPEALIIVRVFDIKYYRESDMKEYNKRSIFFIDSKQVYSYSKALKVDSLQGPIEQLNDYIAFIESEVEPKTQNRRLQKAK